jgi:hypothetical protein
MALDSQGYPHIGYDSSANSMGYAYKDASGWHLETVSSSGDFYQACVSLALDGNSCPHLGLYDGQGQTLRYAYRDDSGWQTQPVDSLGGKSMTSLALTANGLPRITYLHAENGLIYAAASSGGGTAYAIFLPLIVVK